MYELQQVGLGDLERERRYCVLATLGYESRSRFVPSRVVGAGSAKVAMAFNSGGVHAFDANEAWFKGRNFELFPDVSECLEVCFERIKLGGLKGIVIDISCMTRSMIAVLVLSVDALLEACDEIVFAYAPAKFTRPPRRLLPITFSAPVAEEFAGWQTDMTKPVSAVVGLGFEFDRALGALELFEVNSAWLFVPAGEDPRYEKWVSELNDTLIERTRPSGFSEYRVDQPAELYVRLESLVFGLEKKSRPLILPFGPKIFALVALLVAQAHAPQVTVWRVSGYRSDLVVDRKASGKVIGLRLRKR